MTTAEHIWVAWWPILDHSRPFRALVAEACRELDVMAQLEGVRLAGEPRWLISADHLKLICWAPAKPTQADQDDDHVPATAPFPPLIAPEKIDAIRALAGKGLSVNAVRKKVGVHWTTANRYLQMEPDAA